MAAQISEQTVKRLPLTLAILSCITPVCADEGQIFSAAKTAYVFWEYLDQSAMKRCGISYEGVSRASVKGLERTPYRFNNDWSGEGDISFYVSVNLLAEQNTCTAAIFITASTKAKNLQTEYLERTWSPTSVTLAYSSGVAHGSTQEFSLKFYTFLNEVRERLALDILEKIVQYK